MIGEPPEITCPECDVTFTVIWNRNPGFDRPEYCPFCGDEIDYANLQEASE